MHRDRLIKRVVLHHIQDGRKRLVLDDRRLCGHADDRRLDKKRPDVRAPIAATHDLAALGLRTIDRLEHFVHGRHVDQRAHQGGPVQRVANRHLLIRGRQLRDQLGCDRLLHDEPARGGAALSGGADSTKQNRADSQIKPRILTHDDRVVAAQFKNRAAKTCGHHLGHMPSHRRRSGKGDQRHPRVAYQTFAHGTALADQQGKNPGHAVIGHHPVADVLHGHTTQRRRFCGFPDRRIAAHGRKCRVPRPYSDGEIKCGDHPYGSQRMPLLHHPVSRTLRRHRQPVQLPRESHGEVADIDHLLHLAVPFGPNLPHLEADQIAERLLHLAQGVAQVTHEVSTFRGRHFAPPLKRRGRGTDHLVTGGFRGQHHTGDGITRR